MTSSPNVAQKADVLHRIASGLNDWRTQLEGTRAALAYPAAAPGLSAATSTATAKAAKNAPPLLSSTAPASATSSTLAGDDLFAAALALSLALEAVGPAALAATVVGLGNAALGLLPEAVGSWPLAHLATAAPAHLTWASSVAAVEALFYAGCHAYAAQLSATPINELHPYAPAQRRRDWKRILADPATPLPQLAASWHYRADDGSGSRGAVGEYQPAALLARHAQQRLADVLGLAAPASASASSPASSAVRFGELSVGDLEHWLAKSFFAVPDAAHLSPPDAAECAAMVREFEAAAGALLQPSPWRSPGVGSYCAYVGRVAWRHRPLAFYALSHAVGGVAWTGAVMRGHGFERRRQTLANAGVAAAPAAFADADAAAADNELVFWFRPADSGAEGDDAVVFIHGIGIGPAPYMEWVMGASASGSSSSGDTSSGSSGPRPATLVVELACVSQRVSWRAPPPPRRFAALVECALAECLDLGSASAAAATNKCVVVGHSLGSAYATYLSASGSACAHRVSGAVLIDPIACLLFHDRVTKSFVFPDVATVFDAADDYFIKKELFSSAVISRHLPWFEANVWLDDLGAGVPTLVAVSDDDAIVPADAVAAHFGSWPARLRGVRVLRLPGVGHGAWLASPRQRHRLAQGVRSLRQEASLLGAASAAAGEVAGSAASAREAVGSALSGYLGRGGAKRAPPAPPPLGPLLRPPWEMWVRGLNQRSSAPS